MDWQEMVSSGLLVTLVGMVAWVLKILGNHMTHRLDSIDKKLDKLPCKTGDRDGVDC